MKIGRKPEKTTRWGADPRVQAFWRFIRGWVTHNHKAYYTYVVLCAFGVYTFWSTTLIAFYRNRNYEVSHGVHIHRASGRSTPMTDAESSGCPTS